jgi:translocation and assembly module TamB
MTATRLRRGDVSIARIAANVSLRGGRGTVKASLAGSRGRAFDIQTVAQVTPDQIALIARGTLDRRPIELTGPAVPDPRCGGWRLAPVTLAYGGGTATVGGHLGADATAVDAALSRMPLSVAEMFYPGLGLSGQASGRVTYRLPRAAARPAAAPICASAASPAPAWCSRRARSISVSPPCSTRAVSWHARWSPAAARSSAAGRVGSRRSPPAPT